MFSLDNTAIQFPHASVERVSVGKKLWALHLQSDSAQLGLILMPSLEYYICWRCTISSSLSMGFCFPARIAQSPCHHFRTIHQPHPYLLYHRCHKKLCWTSSPWLDRKVQAEERHTGAWFGNRWGLFRNQSPCSSWWMEKLSKRTQQLCLRWAWLPCAGLCWPNARLQTACRPG